MHSFDNIIKLMDEVNGDRSVPRNIRNLVSEARKSLVDMKAEADVRINSAISILEEVSNDPNIPAYTRTHIWNIVSLLETENERLKLQKK